MLVFLCASSATAQDAVVSGQVMTGDPAQPLGYASVSVVSRGTQLLTGESGKFMLLALQPGQVQLRFKRIGFSPKDTTLTLAAGDTARIKVELARLVLQLPTMLVTGKCTNESPVLPQPAVLIELFDQIQQNAERVKLLADARPFALQIIRLFGMKLRDGRIGVLRMDTVVRSPLPPDTYTPKQVVRRGQGSDLGRWVLALPEQPDLADTAFTNNHCLRYAGKTTFESESVIRVDFEPVPWLDKQVDIEGSIYLHAERYQLVGLEFKLNRLPAQFSRGGLQEVSVRARFRELVEGIPVLSEWELTNKSRAPALPRVEQGQVIKVKWRDSTGVVDTVRLLPRLR
jgi:hypothetical protein